MYKIDKLQGEWKKLEESFGNETPSVDPANDMPILDPANENPMVKYNRAIRDWKVWVAGHPNEVPPPRPKRPAQVGPSQPKMGWKRGGQAVWNKLHEGYKELGETLSLPMENEPQMGGESENWVVAPGTMELIKAEYMPNDMIGGLVRFKVMDNTTKMAIPANNETLKIVSDPMFDLEQVLFDENIGDAAIHYFGQEAMNTGGAHMFRGHKVRDSGFGRGPSEYPYKVLGVTILDNENFVAKFTVAVEEDPEFGDDAPYDFNENKQGANMNKGKISNLLESCKSLQEMMGVGGEVDENGAAFKLGVCQAMLGTLFRSLDSAKQQGDFSRFVGEAEKIKQIILSKGVEIR